MTQLTLQCRCGKQYKVPGAARGKRVKCSVCQHSFVVPLPTDTTPVDAIPPAADSISAAEPPDNGFAAFLSENLGAGIPTVARVVAAPPQPIPQEKQIEKERAQIDAELAELKDQMKEEFMIGHAIIKARGRLNQRIEEARANAPVESRPVGGGRLITAIGFFVGGFGGVLFATFLRSLWPQRSVRSKVTFGKLETAGLDAAAQYGRRRAVSTQARSEALDTLLNKEIPWSARMTAEWGSSLCAVMVSLGLLILALFMNWVQPILGVIFLGIVLFGWTFVRRELVPLNDAIADYPQVAARIGRRRVNQPTSVLAVLLFLLLFGASSAWVGWTTYDWGRGLFAPPLAKNTKPNGTELAEADKKRDSELSRSQVSRSQAPSREATADSPLPDRPGGSIPGNSPPLVANGAPASETSGPGLAQLPPPTGTPASSLSSERAGAVGSPSNVPSAPIQPANDSSLMKTVKWTPKPGFGFRFTVEFPQENLLATRWGAVGKKANSTNAMWCVVGPIDEENLRRTRLQDRLTGDPVKTLELAVVECEYEKVIKSVSTAAHTTMNEWLSSNLGDTGPQSKVDIRGAYARDFSVTKSNGNLANIRIIVKGQFVYLVSAVYPDKSWERYALQFIESFHLPEANALMSR